MGAETTTAPLTSGSANGVDAAIDVGQRFHFNERTLFRIAVVIAASPILIAAVRNGLQDWYPTGDAAATAIRINDVFSSHPPLVGLPAHPTVTAGLTYAFPGPFLLYLLAVPVKLLGVSWGLLVGMGLLNTAWFVSALWLIRRRVGYRWGLIACAFGASLLWTVGSQILVDPTPMQIGSVSFLAFLVAAWSVAECDAKGLVPFAFSANFLLLDQLMFAVVVPLVGLISLGIWTCRLRRTRSRNPKHWQLGRRSRRRWFFTSVAVTVALWLPPVAQQLFYEGGNLGTLMRAATGSGSGVSADRGLLDAIGVVASPIATWPLWFRDSILHPNFDANGPTTPFLVEGLGIAVVLALCLVVGRGAWKRHDTTFATALVVGNVAWAGWLVSAYLNPDRTAYNRHYFLALWPLSMFIWLILVAGAFRGVQCPRNRLSRFARAFWKPMSLGVVGLFVVATVPVANFGAGTRQQTIPTARKVHRAIVDKVSPGGLVLVQSDMPLDQVFLPTVLLSLQQTGTEFRVSSPFWIRTVGAHRAFQPKLGKVERELLITRDPSSVSPGARLVVHTRPTFPTSYYALGTKMHAWAASVTNLQLPATSSLPADERKAVNQALDQYRAVARSQGKTLLDLVWFVTLFAGSPPALIAELVDIPGVSTQQIQSWLKMRSHDLLDSVWVYLIPR